MLTPILAIHDPNLLIFNKSPGEAFEASEMREKVSLLNQGRVMGIP